MTITTQHQMLPPGARATTTTVANGRTYTCALGSVLTAVPAWDADELESNGWIKASTGGANTTANRPTTLAGGVPLPVGFRFFDQSLGYEVIWDGSGSWRNPATGAAV